MPAPRKTIERYGLTWPHNSDPLRIEFYMIQHGGKWKDAKGKVCGLGLFHHYRAAESLCFPEDDHNKWSDLILKHILEQRITVVLGSKDCISGDTKIPNPTTGQSPTIQSLCESKTAPVVMTLRGPVLAGIPFLKGEAELFEVICSDGSSIRGTAGHLVLTPSGFVRIDRLCERQSVLLGYDASRPSSILEPAQAIQRRDALRLSQTIQGSQADCLPALSFCGGQPHYAKAVSQSSFPLPIDARARNHENWHRDDLVGESICSPVCRLSARPSSVHFYCRDHRLVETSYLLRSSLGTLSGECNSSQFWPESGTASCPVSAFGRSPRDSFRRHLAYRSSSRSVCQLAPFFGDASEPLPPKAPSDRQLLAHISTPQEVPPFASCLPPLHHSFSSPHCEVVRKLVQEIRRIGVHKFYDIQVPDAHHYFAGGLIHHNSGKTHRIAKYGIIDYWCFPETTLIMISSTTAQGLDLRVWGSIKDLFNRARRKYDWLPGNVVDSKRGIFTDAVDIGGEARDTRKGIIAIACRGAKGEWVGVDSFVGLKQKRRRMIGDELAFMHHSYLRSLEHLDKGDFKFVGAANPLGEGDPADKMAEPVGGWGTEPESEKTEVWQNRWGGITISLDGLDTPNNDEPKNRFPYLICQEDIDRTAKRRGNDSAEYWTQARGKRKANLNAKRVLNRQMCINFGAFNPVIWAGSATTKVYAIDASYGGDRCVAGPAEFGQDVAGRNVLSFGVPKEIQIAVNTKVDGEAEDQIAKFVKRDAESEGIPAGNIGFDSTGKGSLGTAFGRIGMTEVNPVEFGGTPTTRPVSQGIFVFDDRLRAKRLKRCDEEYSKRVTEYWFAVRHIVESRQCRNLPEICADEFGIREWYRVNEHRIEIETKDETKARMGRSPDYADWACIIVEMARRLGFTIDGLVDEQSEMEDDSWLRREVERHRKFLRKNELSYK